MPRVNNFYFSFKMAKAIAVSFVCDMEILILFSDWPWIKTTGAPLLSFKIEISLNPIEFSLFEKKIAFKTASFAANFPEKCMKGLDLELQYSCSSLLKTLLNKS